MLVSNIRVVEQAEFVELRADLKCDTHWVWGEDAFPLWIRYPKQCHTWLDPTNGDPFLAILLVPAMALGESLTIEGFASPKLLESIPQIQSIYRCWDSAMSVIDVNVAIRPLTSVTPSCPTRRGLFFSMGVDSSYCLWKDASSPHHSDSITDLIVVQGFDVYLWEGERFPPMLNRIKAVAAEFNKNVLAVTTNLREFSDRMADWLRFYHGPALVSIALSLSDYFSCVDIAAAQTYAQLVPRGAHPLLDYLWSTENVEFRHNGLEATRLQKILSIAKCDSIVENLRVCTTSELTDAYNCGQCEKCLRTMIALHIANVLPRSRSFPKEIDIERVSNLSVKNSTAATTLRQLIDSLGTTEQDLLIKKSLQACLSQADAAQ